MRPQIALRSPTVIVGNTVSATSTVDDATYTMAAPFALSFYGASSTNIIVSSNGLPGISPVTTAYSNLALPVYSDLANGVAPFWDDIYINTGDPQGIFYRSEGASPNRTLTYEWYVTHYQALTTYAHFLVASYEALPNWVTIDYLNVTDNGVGATVGIESSSGKRHGVSPCRCRLFVLTLDQPPITASTPSTRL